MAATGQTLGKIVAAQKETIDAAVDLIGKQREDITQLAHTVQDPRKMGDLSVRALADLIQKKAVAPMVDTGAVLATKANMDEPAVQRLLQ